MITKSDGGLMDFDETLGLAACSVECDAGCCSARARFGITQLRDERIGIVDARLGFGCASLRAAPEPLHLHADTVAQALLGALLPFGISLALFEKFGIAAFDAQ